MREISKIRILFIAAVLLLTPLTLFFAGTGDGDSRIGPPPYYHNGTINVNLTLSNGSAAEGYRVSFIPDRTYSTATTLTDLSGKAVLNVSFDQLGHGKIRVRDTESKWRYTQYTSISPNEITYLDIQLDDLPSFDHTLTGTIRNKSSGLAVPGMEVRITGYDIHGNSYTVINTTETDGSYSLSFSYALAKIFNFRVTGTVEYRSFYSSLFTNEGRTELSLDVDLMPKFLSDGASRVRFINASTGSPITNATLIIQSTPEDNDHRGIYGNQIPDGDGWFSIDSSKGEVSLSLTTEIDQYPGTSVSIARYVVMNGTPSDMEYHLDIPDPVTYDITVSNSTSTLNTASISWDQNLFREDGIWYFYYSSVVDLSGSLEFPLPVDQDIALYVSAPSHFARTIDLRTAETGYHVIGVELEEKGSSIPPTYPMGDVIIEIIDDLTGIPVRNALISGTVFQDGHWFYESMNANGTGVYDGKIIAGDYQDFKAGCSFGEKYIGDITIIEGTNDLITIRLDRIEPRFTPVPEEYIITVKDTSGTAIPFQSIRCNLQSGSTGYGMVIETDANGKIYLNANPGTDATFNMDTYSSAGDLNLYAIQEQTVELPMTGGDLGDLILQPRGIPEEVFGFVKDKTTGGTISSVHISTSSYRPATPSRMMMGPVHPDGISLFSHSTGSQVDGLYRTWGMDHIQFRVYRDEYYPFEKIVDLTTRAPSEYDILMDPMGSITYWVNGTLFDQDGAGIPGYVEAADIDHPLFYPGGVSTDEFGVFSFQLLPGNYSLRGTNETIWNTVNITVKADMSDVNIVLAPTTGMVGIVKNDLGQAIEGINISLENKIEDTWTSAGTVMSNDTGNFIFEVGRGTYRVITERTVLFDPFTGSEVTTDGWTPIEIEVILANRTVADIVGSVIGQGGPFSSGIPDVNVSLMQGNVTISTTTTENDGSYKFVDVVHGVYGLFAIPPEYLAPIQDTRSGYLENSTWNITSTGVEVAKNIYLPYQEEVPLEYLNITFYSPVGVNVYIDSNIVIGFSHVMHPELFESVFMISPVPMNLTFTWNEFSTLVIIGHDDLLPDTNYTITLPSTLVTYQGFALWESDGFSWWFITGNTTDPWAIYTANVTMDSEKNVLISVTGPENLTIYMFLDNVDFILLEEGPDGTYTAYVNGTELAWDTDHPYYFTDSYDGYDLAPSLSGILTTPEEPYTPLPWEITNVTVEVRESGTWDVNVNAEGGITIFIVIDGVGSFELGFNGPGNYRVLIPYENFEWEEEYDYHFSETEDGPDMASPYAGTAVMPKEPSSNSTGDPPPFFLFCCLLLIVLIIIIAVIVMLIRKRSDEDAFEE